MSEEEMPSVDDALNEYFRLKQKFENELSVKKRRIINNVTLSKREKRAEFLKLMPKCVNCKKPSTKGTIFSITYNPSNDKTDAYRIIRASCGNLVNQCNLNIEIHIGLKERLDEAVNYVRNEIIKHKNNIIDDKNKLLFGLMTTETALENFDNNKSYIFDMTSIYETYLDVWNNKVENPQKKIELEEAMVQSYQSIDSIKDCIKKMNENNDKQYAVDAAHIYHNTLHPLLQKIRKLKYTENNVFSDDTYCKLIQKPYSIDDLLISGYDDKVVFYNVGLTTKQIQKKLPNPKGFIIEDSSEESGEQSGGEHELNIKFQEPTEIEEDEPIIGQGKHGIAWNNPKYQKLWDNLSDHLKMEFKLNIDWMKEFMNKCVNENKECGLTTPPNIIIPPRKMNNGQYDFGVSIYNKAFNKLPQATQVTYLSFYEEDPLTKSKDYKKFEDIINSLVEQEVNFSKGFF
jgi:predicted HD phosphohydrolase